jgi:hypothetical protein
VHCKSKGKDEENNVVSNYCKKPDYIRANSFKLMKKDLEGNLSILFERFLTSKNGIGDVGTTGVESKSKSRKI